jgi:dTDP-4-dehydrorhamnose reductase
MEAVWGGERVMILVTGASGLLGATVLLLARDSGRGVAGLCHSHSLHLPGVPTFNADLTNSGTARALIAKLRPTAIIHCAAVTGVDWCEGHPIETERINAESPGFLAGLAKELGARFVYISTDSVFDGARGKYSESDLPCPLNVYAKSKLNGEHTVLRENPDALVVRVNIYGWNAQEKQSLAEWILGQLLAERKVPGFTDVIFSPILVNDLAEILLEMLNLGLTGIYHVTGSESISKYEFARSVATTFGLDINLVFPAQLAHAKLRAPRPLNVSLNTGKSCAALGREMPGVLEGLRRFKILKDNGYAQELREYLTEVVA